MDTNSSGIWYTRNRRVSGYKIASFRNKAKGSPNFDKSVKNSAGHTRDESFQMYAKSVFKKSLITGLPQIANSRTWRRRIRKILILLFCLMGFLYQTGNFLQYFWTYPTVSYIEDSSPYEVVQPALTFCSNNQIRRQVYCEQNDSSCEIFDDHEKFCNSFPSYCIKNETYYGIPTVLDAYSNVFSTSWEEAIEFSPTEEMISTCRKITDSNFTFCSVRRFPVVSQRVNPTFCYTVESQINYPFSADVIYPNTFEYDIQLHTFPEEYFFSTDDVLMYIVVHNRRHLVNPYKEGIVLKGGYLYKLFVSMKEDIRLSYPYATNCTDYLRLWNENNGSGPLNERACIEYCKLEKLKLEGECIDEYVWYAPHHEELCDMSEKTTTNEMIKDCGSKCQPACREQTYDVKYDEIEFSTRLCDQDDINCRKSDVFLSVSFRKFQLSKHIFEPKYKSIELFSYIGGYMGMWLGISLVSIFDLLESLCYLLYYPFMPKKVFKNRIS